MSLMKTVPMSDADNVYDFLRDVMTVILEEPKRVNMHYVAIGRERSSISWVKPNTTRHVQLPMPSCGTIGCFSGWCQMLAGRTVEQAKNGWTFGAIKILGTNLRYEFLGDDGLYHHFFNWGEGDGIVNMKPGTRAYARKVCQRINKFIEVNGGKAALKLLPVNRAL